MGSFVYESGLGSRLRETSDPAELLEAARGGSSAYPGGGTDSCGMEKTICVLWSCGFRGLPHCKNQEGVNQMESYEALCRAHGKRRYEELAGFFTPLCFGYGYTHPGAGRELYSCMAAVEWLKKQKNPYTAVGAELESLARERGVFRREALKAKGKLRFSILSPSQYDIEIPAGTVCAAEGENGARYITLQKVVLPQGSTSGGCGGGSGNFPEKKGNAAAGECYRAGDGSRGH